MNATRRAENIALLRSLLSSTASPTQVARLRQRSGPIYVTLNLGDATRPVAVNDLCYHIEVKDGQSRSYWQYADGRIVEQSVQAKP